MRLLPSSLVGRLITAMLAAVTLSAIIVVWLVQRERREMVFWGGDSTELIEFLAHTSESLAVLPADERDAQVAALKNEPIALSRGTRPVRRPPAYDDIAAARSYAKRLKRELGSDFTVEVRPAMPSQRDFIRIRNEGPWQEPPDRARGRWADRSPRSGHELDVVVTLADGDAIRYRVPAPRSGPPMPMRIFAELVVLTLLLSLILFWMARGITRPLSALARSAEAMSRGDAPEPLPETGAAEIRHATRAFNAMHDRLQRYLKSRNRMLAAMSHDLRTPLTRLRLRAERLQDPALRDKFVSDVDQMTAMLKATLDLFRDMNNDEAYEAVDIMALLADLQEEFRDMDADVSVRGSAHGALDAKPNALKRCLTNLLTNAVKYGERAVVVVEDGDSLVIRVRDEGPGLPPDALEKVFEPFFRLESSRNPATGGTGLGLAIARDIAQAHGGTLVLCNQEPRGLEAVLTLPRNS